MRDNFWKRINRWFNRTHLQDTELKINSESVFINPALKLLVGWILFLIVFLIFLLVGKPFAKDREDISEDKELQSNVQEDSAFEHNQYPEVNIFVEKYMQAITDCDINMLSTMVVDASQFDAEVLQKKKEFIVGYSNIECYTKPGLTEGSYVVYAVMNTQINGVNVQPLSLHQFYLIPSEYGGFLQDNTSSTNPDIEAYLEQLNEDPDVIELVNRVNQNNEESAQADETLKAFYDKMNGATE